MLLKMRRLKDRGDTIVEVMLVLSILGFALSISYATANQSLLNTRQAQENTEATQLAQSQIEALRTMKSADGILVNNQPYCIYNAATAGPPDYKVALYSGTTPASQCSPASNSNLYTISIVYKNSSNNFTVTITWGDVSGQGIDTVTQEYRFYPS